MTLLNADNDLLFREVCVFGWVYFLELGLFSCRKDLAKLIVGLYFGRVFLRWVLIYVVHSEIDKEFASLQAIVLETDFDFIWYALFIINFYDINWWFVNGIFPLHLLEGFLFWFTDAACTCGSLEIKSIVSIVLTDLPHFPVMFSKVKVLPELGILFLLAISHLSKLIFNKKFINKIYKIPLLYDKNQSIS